MGTLAKTCYNLAYRLGTPRWDNGVVPPELVRLADGNHAKTALDLGCGTGTTALYLAQRGMDVVGIDFSSRAIEVARAKAQRAHVNVDFRVSDVTNLDFVNNPFDLVVDIGCYHGLDQAARARYANQVVRLTHPGSRLLMWSFNGTKFLGTFGATAAQVQKQFAPQFNLMRVVRNDSIANRPGAWYWLERENA